MYGDRILTRGETAKNEKSQPPITTLLSAGRKSAAAIGVGRLRHTVASRYGIASENTPVVARNPAPTSATTSRGFRMATTNARTRIAS